MHPQSITTDYINRFWAQVARGAPDACWPWRGAPGPRGYGHAPTAPDGTRRAHRVAWLLTHGSIPDKLHVLHTCDNPPCCNPAHLWLGTHAQNVADMIQKGRHRPGHAGNRGYHNRKLTPDAVRAMRLQMAEGIKDQTLAAAYRVSQATVRDIRLRYIWAHVQ